MQHVLQQEAGADQHDAELEPELVGGDAGAEDAWRRPKVFETMQAEDDGPQDVLNLRKVKVMLRAQDGEDVFEQLAEKTDPNSSAMPGSMAANVAGRRCPSAIRGYRWIRRSMSGNGHRQGLGGHMG